MFNAAFSARHGAYRSLTPISTFSSASDPFCFYEEKQACYLPRAKSTDSFSQLAGRLSVQFYDLLNARPIRPNNLSDFSTAHALLTKFKYFCAQQFLIRIAPSNDGYLRLSKRKAEFLTRRGKQAPQDYEPLTSTIFACIFLAACVIVK
jgi:hypothetical protein